MLQSQIIVCSQMTKSLLISFPRKSVLTISDSENIKYLILYSRYYFILQDKFAYVFLVRIWLECIASAFLLISWPQLYLWVNFHYHSIIHKRIELSVPLWGRKTLEIFSNQALDSLPERQPTHLQRNSIKSFSYDSLVYCNTPHILTQHAFTGMPMIKFQRALILEEGWKMTTDIGQPWHFP